MKPAVALPLWARVSDLLVCALIALWLAILFFGGFRLHVGGQRLLSITSPARVLLWIALIAGVRHALVRNRPLHRRVQEGAWARRKDLAALLTWTPYIAAAAFFLSGVASYYNPETGFTQLIGFGGNFAEEALPAVKAAPHHIYEDSWGYDGQFYAQLATDPLLRDPELATAIDAPAFRARRMLFCWSAYIL